MPEHRDSFRGCVITIVTREFQHAFFNKTYYHIGSVTITRDGKQLDYVFAEYENRDEGEVYKIALGHAQQHIASLY